MVDRHKTVHAEDLDLFLITDDSEAAVQHINQFYAGRAEELAPNFEL
jgi:hypothetical protein